MVWLAINGIVVNFHCSVTDPVLIEKIVCPTGLIVSSFETELHATFSGLIWFLDYMDNWRMLVLGVIASLCL